MRLNSTRFFCFSMSPQSASSLFTVLRYCTSSLFMRPSISDFRDSSEWLQNENNNRLTCSSRLFYYHSSFQILIGDQQHYTLQLDKFSKVGTV